MFKNFEAVGDMADWPPNERGKQTQAAVFGVYHPKKGVCCEIIWTGTFPDLEPAMYWAAKKEAQAVRKEKWMMASRVLWQHDLTPEQAVAACQKQMAPQLKKLLKQFEAGAEGPDDIDIGKGPMKRVKPGEAESYYVEVTPKDSDEPIASFIGGPPSNDVDVEWLGEGGSVDELKPKWIPRDPREE